MKSKAITIVLTLIAIFAPLLIIPETKTYDYNILKFGFLMLAGVVLLILLLINFKKFKLDIKDILIFVFLGLSILSTVYSSNIKKSIFGEEGRYEGLLMFVIYICIYIASKKFFIYNRPKKFFDIIFYVSLIIGVLGILQRHINCWKLYPIFNRLIASTFGNSNFFGSYISLILPGAMCAFILYNTKKGFLLSIILVFNMIASGTRSAWAAFVLIGIIGIIYLIKNKNRKYFMRALILLITFIIIFIYLYNGLDVVSIINNNLNLFTNKNINMSQYTEKKFKQIIEDIEILKKEGISNTIGSWRIYIWSMVMELIYKQPLLGCGPDNLQEGLINNCIKSLIEYVESTGTVIDKAHNEYMQIAATVGIPALIIYLGFLALIVLPKMKIIFKDKISFIIFLIILSYLAQAFFNISTIGVAPVFWMILGLSDNEEFILKIKAATND